MCFNCNLICVCLTFRYYQAHPDASPKPPEGEDIFESDNQRELRQIFTSQSQMFGVLRDLGRKMDEIVGRQERELSMLSAIQGQGR